MNENPDWLLKLADEIDEMLANPKRVKFNTHKNRKEFSGEIRSMIIEAYRANVFKQGQKPSVVKLKEPGKSFVVMTESQSMKADEHAGRSPL